MAKRVLAIGVGGSGKTSLTILKERLEETYGQVPDNVVLLSLDTDSLRDVDRFAGTRLNPAFDERNRLPEFQQVVSPGGMTMDTIFADIRSNKTSAYMNWLEIEKLDRMLSPAERDIRGGAQQRRPIGRTALILRYANPVFQSIVEAIGKMYGESERDQQTATSTEEVEKGKRLIFLVSSVAGGTGSGMLLDVANLVRHAINRNQNWQSVSVSAVIVLPDAFASYTRFMDDPTNLKPNSYAALREFDRFMRVHSSELPYMVRYAENQQSITWSTNQPVDHVYLMDTASRSSSQDFDLSGDPGQGVFPAVADFMMAHIDDSLGDALATLRSNAGQHYDKGTGRMYSSFNVMSYIFPADDVIESFSYRFVRELLARLFLPIPDEKRRVQVEQEALGEIEKSFTTSTVAGRANPNIVQKAIVGTRKITPETPDMSWAGLFSLISLSDTGFAEHYQSLQQSLEYLQGGLVLTKDGDYRRESFEEGVTRLLNFTDQFQDDYLGKPIDPNDPDARAGGDWDAILSAYRDALRLRFGEVLDAALLDILNRRDDQKRLLASRLPYARALVVHLKAYMVRFKALLEKLWQDTQVETTLRQVGEEVRNAMTWMNDTRGKTYFPPLMTEPRKAQESFRSQFVERMNLTLHRRVYHTVLDVLDALGAAEKDKDGQKSVLDIAMLELEGWERTLQGVDGVIAERDRKHAGNRKTKLAIKVRKYLTDEKFEDELYKRPDHFPAVAARILGQVGDQKGLLWQRLNDQIALDFKLVTTWGDEAKGAEEIANTWFAGTKELFQVVRNNVTIAERLAAWFPGHASFTNRCLQVDEPFLRYNPSKNDSAPFPERYVSFNLEKAHEESARQFLQSAYGALRSTQGMNVDTAAESVVACSVVEISRGFKLIAAEPFNQCEPEYRAKITKGRESIHLFPEEQYATELEQSIPTLGETDNQLRALVPELTVAMGNRDKLRAFTLACAYGLVTKAPYFDPETGAESGELFLKLGGRRLPLSQSTAVAKLDPAFPNLPESQQLARLYLNALQNFMLKITERPGFNLSLVEQVKGDLQRRGVSLTGIDSPFTLALREVNLAINEVALGLGPSEQEVAGEAQRQAQNAARRLKEMEAFLRDRVSTFKDSVGDQRVRDMGTVMHLILRDQMNQVRLASRSA
jgi:hypothetical protein